MRRQGGRQAGTHSAFILDVFLVFESMSYHKLRMTVNIKSDGRYYVCMLVSD